MLCLTGFRYSGTQAKPSLFGGGAFAFKGLGLRAKARVWVIGAHGLWELLCVELRVWKLVLGPCSIRSLILE